MNSSTTRHSDCKTFSMQNEPYSPRYLLKHFIFTYLSVSNNSWPPHRKWKQEMASNSTVAGTCAVTSFLHLFLRAEWIWRDNFSLWGFRIDWKWNNLSLLLAWKKREPIKCPQEKSSIETQHALEKKNTSSLKSTESFPQQISCFSPPWNPDQWCQWTETEI